MWILNYLLFDLKHVHCMIMPWHPFLAVKPDDYAFYSNETVLFGDIQNVLLFGSEE